MSGSSNCTISPQFARSDVGFRTLTGGQRLRGVVPGLPKTRAAIAYAETLHAGQRRSFDGGAFIGHPLEVALLLHDAGAPDRVIAAGVLHDSIESGGAAAADLKARFGGDVARLVVALTEDRRIHGYARRKASLRRQVATAGGDALVIFAADKVSKVRELRLTLERLRRRGARPDESLLRPRRLVHYRRCLGMLEELLGDPGLVHRLRAELVRLEAASTTTAQTA